MGSLHINSIMQYAMPHPSYLCMQLEVGCHLVFQLPWHGNLTLPESCSLGMLMQRTRFDPVVIPSVWLPFFCLFVSSFFAASSVRVICPFQGFLGLIFTLPGGTLSLEEMS